MSNLFHDDHYTVSELTKKLASKLTDAGLRLTTAESCTGGKLSVALCAEENTADFYDVGLVVFSDEAKARILGVRSETLARYTAVSEPTVGEMAASIRDMARRISALPSADTQALKGATMGRRQGRSALAGIFAARRKPAPFFSPVTVRTWWKKRCILRWLNW